MRYTTAFIAAVIATVALLTTPAAAFDLDSLLVASIGGPEALDSLRYLTSVRARGSADLNGMVGRFEMVYAVPDRIYLKMNFDLFSVIQAYDGKIAWQVDFNNQTSQLAGYEKNELLKNLYFESASYLLPDRLPGSREYLGDTVIADTTYHLVAFYPLNLDTVLAFYNRETGRRSMTTSKMDNFEAIERSYDYRQIHGIWMPFHSHAEAPAAGISADTHIERVQVNVPVDMSLFAMPGERARDFRFPAGVEQITIPIVYAGGHIQVPAKVNGATEAWFILDSGSSANFIHGPISRSLSLSVVGTLPARGVGGFQEVDLVRVDSLSIGELTLYNQVVGSADLELLATSRSFGHERPFGGLLGYDLLSRFPVLVSYRDSTITVFNPMQFEPPEPGVTIPFHLTMAVPTISAELNGLRGDFLVDLGNALGLIIHHGFARSHDLVNQLDDVQDNSSTLQGVGGDIGGKNALAESFKIGDILIQSLRVLLPDSTTGIAGSEKLAGNIGNMILEGFDVLFDYQHSRLIFYERKT